MTPEQAKDISEAMLAFWTSHDEAVAAQAARGVTDVGGRAGVTSGGHLDRVAQLLGRICIRAGAPIGQVYYKAPKDDPNRRHGAAIGYTLPGYYRPTKQWDVVIYCNNLPIAIIELKSQKGPSYGNNANNRAEEAVGNAIDLTRARDAGLVPGNPWTGYVFVIEDDLESMKARGNRDRGYYQKDPIFSNWSYLDRVKLLTQRLVEEGHYDSAWAVATTRPPNFAWRELDENVSGYVQFITALTATIGRHYPDAPGAGQPHISLRDGY